MTVASGIVAALLAPLLEAVGFLGWDMHWKDGGGSAFALNLYKCNLAAIGFLLMTIWSSEMFYMTRALDAVVGEWRSTDRDGDVGQSEKVWVPNIAVNSFDLSVGDRGAVGTTVMVDHNQAWKLDSSQLHLPKSENPHRRRLQEEDSAGFDNFATLLAAPDSPSDLPAMSVGQKAPEVAEFISIPRPPRPTTFDNVNVAPHIDTNDVPQFRNMAFLLLSSLLGIILGDTFELEALRLIGARRVLIVDTVKPFAAALLGHIILGEGLHSAAFLGMVLTVGGVVTVMMVSIDRLRKEGQKLRRASSSRRMSSLLAGADAIDNDSTGTIGMGSSTGILDGTDTSDSGNSGIDSSSDRKEQRKVMLVGMRRRAVSRHDLQAEYEDAVARAEEIGGEDDEELMGLMEDGRGIGGGLSPSAPGAFSGITRRRMNSWGSFGSYDGSSMDVDSDGYDDFAEEHNAGSFLMLPPMFERVEASEEAKRAADETAVVSMPAPPPSNNSSSSSRDKDNSPPKSHKSILKKPSFVLTTKQAADLVNHDYGSKDIDDMIDDEDDTQQQQQQHQQGQSHVHIVAPPTLYVLSNGSKEDGQQPKGGGKPNSLAMQPAKLPERKISRDASAGSLFSSNNSLASSIQSECGPPPDWATGKIKREKRGQRQTRLRRGYILATLNVLADAYGSMLTKRHGGEFNTWEINLIRMGFAAFVMTFISIAMRMRAGGEKGGSSSISVAMVPWYKLPKMSMYPWIVVSLGVLFVTFLTPALTNYALFEIALGLAVTLNSVTPLYTLPLGYLMKGERVTRRAAMGAIVAVSGVVVLCIWGVDEG